MKNITKYILLAFMACSLMQCYNDKGNYDYKALNDVYVDTIGKQTVYTIGQFDRLEIKPDIRFTSGSGDLSQLSYRWMIYIDTWTNSESFMTELSTEKDLDVIISQPQNSSAYAVMLYITNHATNTVSQMKYTLNILPTVVSGMLILHSDSEGVDFDYIATTNTVPTLTENRRLENVISMQSGTKMSGNPLSISSVRRNSTVVNWVYVGTDTDFRSFSGEDLSPLRDASSLFLAQPERIRPYGVWRGTLTSGNSVSILVNDDDVYCISNNAAAMWVQDFSGPLKPSATLTGTVSAAPYVYISNTSDNNAQCAGILYDKSGKRFFGIEYSYMSTYPGLLAFTDQTSALFDVNNIGMDMLYMSAGYEGEGLAVFTDGTRRWLYRMNFNITNVLGSDELAIARHDMSNATGAMDAQFYACGRHGYVFLYATDRDIYTFDYSGSGSSTKISNDFPAGETITAMCMYDIRNMSDMTEITGRYLYVATWNGTEGKVYEFQINRTSGRLENNGNPLNTFTGFGRVADICVREQGV